MSTQSNQKIKSRAAGMSVVSNTALVFIKLIVGLFTGSVSVLSEAIHSGIDLLAAMIAWIAVRSSGKPADREHPFGHGKFENLSGTIEALLIFLAAGWIIYEAVHKLINPEPVSDLSWGICVMLLSAVVNLLISSYLMRVGRKTDSMALKADAWHLRTDVYTSAGVMAGLAVIWIGHWIMPSIDLQWIDPVSAIVVAILILHASWKLAIQAGSDLVDVALPDNEVEWIKKHLASFAPAARGCHNLRTRKAGSSYFIEVHVVVEAHMSVLTSHTLTQHIDSAIRERFTNCHITIHIEPCTVEKPDNTCSEHCLAGCFISVNRIPAPHSPIS